MWTAVLLSHLANASARRLPDDLEARLAALVERGQAAWPMVAVPPESFVQHLARHLPATGELAAALDALRADDLFLACGCARGDPAALSAFEQHHLSQVPRYLRGLRRDAPWVDEVLQLLRTRLLVQSADAPPRIAEYAGRGSLHGFVRVTAVRTAQNLLRRREERPGARDEEVLEQVLAGPEDLELKYLRERYSACFRQAFLDALAGLERGQRDLLRLHFAEGRRLEAIGALFQVNRSTVSRWLASARAAVFDQTLRLLGERMQVAPQELHSLTRLLQSQIDISIAGALREAPSGS